ncbi:shikimate kinase [Faecalimonas umbilicata]|nr:shikimate kinase [Faecalimonas umbilicata]
MDNIIFIGMPSAGKSTIGVVAAKRMGYEFVDTDLLIQKQENRLLKDIIAEKGIDGFLAIEDSVNASVEAEHAIISPGGSAIYCKNAMKHFKEIGTVVYLRVSFQTISERIGDARQRGVVLKEGQTLKDLYDERTALFEKYADITICEDGLTLAQTIDKVLEALESR